VLRYWFGDLEVLAVLERQREGSRGEGATLPPAGQPAQLALADDDRERTDDESQARKQPTGTVGAALDAARRTQQAQ
jgi:hypothetical protein